MRRGLGKSLQSLTALAVLRMEKNRVNNSFLVVCPASVVLHWLDETARFFPADLLCAVRYEDLTSRKHILQAASIVVVSYDMLRRDVTSGDGSRLLGTVWEAVVLDEAHLIKNPAAATTKAVGALQCKHRIALSGTPVQNQVRCLRLLVMQPGHF